MKFLRFLLTVLVLAVLVAAVLIGLAAVPAVQTWLAQKALAERPGLHASVGSLSVGLGQIDVADLRVEDGSAILTVPSLEARLPVATALRDRKLRIGSLVAKGWTLDLRGAPEPAASRPAWAVPESEGSSESPAPAEAGPALAAGRVFEGILDRFALSVDTALDGVDLEGDVLVARAAGRASARVHVTIQGGGMAAGREGRFEFTGATVFVGPELAVISLAAKGRITVAMASPRTFGRVDIRSDLSGNGGPLADGVAASADVSAAREADGEAYVVDLSRGDRHLATFHARYPARGGALAGTWKLDLSDADAAPFASDQPLPSFTATGEGRFDTDAAFDQVRVAGRLNSALGRLEAFSPALANLGPVKLDADFDAVRNGRSIRVSRINVALGGDRPSVTAHSLQPFSIDAATAALAVSDPAADWLDVSIKGLPPAWLSALAGGWTFSEGAVSGEFAVRAGAGTFALRPLAPLAVAGVSVARGGCVLGRGLDVSAWLSADDGAAGWRTRVAPLEVTGGGHRLATLAAEASRPPGDGQPVAVSGTWSADLDGLAAAAPRLDEGGSVGRSASGSFTASLGPAPEAKGVLTVMGHAAGSTLKASFQASVDSDGTISCTVPLTLALGSRVSDLSAEGLWIPSDSGARIDGRLSGGNVYIEHLRLLAGVLSAASRIGSGITADPKASRDRAPFWGTWTGRVATQFDRLMADGREITGVNGTLDFDPGSLRLTNGWGNLDSNRRIDGNGSIAFDARAARPYRLKATASLDRIELGDWFPSSPSGPLPAIEGRFALVGTLTGDGTDPAELAGRTQVGFRLTSPGGIIRLLKTSVAEAVPQGKTVVPDAVDTAGSFVGSLFGFKHGSSYGKNPVSKTAEAVIDFTYDTGEIGCDRIAIVGVREPDRSIRLIDVAATAPDQRLTGSGRIAYVKGAPLRDRPISLDLRLWVRGRSAKYLARTSLLSTPKDAQGYTLVTAPIHLGGTLEHVDLGAWHDLLVKAATAQPATAGK